MNSPSGAVGILPAPLYFIGSNSQIWRLEVDAKTAEQITSEDQPISHMDVSPADSSVVFVSGNLLIHTDRLGHNRAILLNGPSLSPTPDAKRIADEISYVAWSPDGSQIAYGLNGVNLYALADGKSRTVLPNDPYPTDLSLPLRGPVRFFRPDTWSHDGKWLLVAVSYFPEGGGMMVLNVADGTTKLLTNPDGAVCCSNSWALDDRGLYFANDTFGLVGAGLWRADLTSGSTVALIKGEDNGLYSMAAYPQQLADGQLYYFLGTADTLPQGFTKLTMTRSAPDGVTGRTSLRRDSYEIGEVLWSPDGRGVVIMDRIGQISSGVYPFVPVGPLIWLSVGDIPAVPLPVPGFSMHWGK